MNQLDRHYQDLLFKLIVDGRVKDTRNGKTISIFGHQIRHKMSEGFPLLTTKKMYWRGIVTELLWFLSGDTNIKYLVDNNCHIWDGDAYKNYLTEGKKLNEQTGGVPDYYTQDEFINKIKTDAEFAKQWGELGPIYGKQWRKWKTFRKVTTNTPSKPTDSVDYIDQIANLISDLKTNPDSRRLMVSAWNPAELDQMTLPPCHYGFQTYTRELSLEERNQWFQIHRNGNNPTMKSDWKDFELDQQNIPKRAISLMWNQRSVDVFLGLPFNIASYGLLLEIIAKEVNMVPEELIGNLGDTHLYQDHLDQAREQIGREPYDLPKLKLDDWYSTQGDVNNSTEVIMDCLMGLNHGHITLENYQSHPTIKAPLSN
jgi:thymidylate synthase